MTKTPDGYTEKRWQEAGSALDKLIAGDNAYAWAWGDWAHEYCPASTRGGAGTDRALERLLEEHGYEGSVDTVRARRAVAAAWPNDIRISLVPWSVHQILATLEDRADVIRSRSTWTAAAARAFVQERRDREQLDGELRYQLVNTFGALRLAVQDTVRQAEELFSQLRAPIPQAGPNGRDAMLLQLHEARDLLVGYLPRVETDGTVDEAIAQILKET